eukprot:Skav219292  [mRNA]  locus=scaffold2157:358081:360192:+ [translate_table: standard]
MITIASLSGAILLRVHEDTEDDARYPTVRDLIGHISSGTFGIRPAPQQLSIIKNDDTRPLEHHELVPGDTTVTYIVTDFHPHDVLEADRLIAASSRGLVTMVAQMLERLVDPNITVNGCTGLHMALDRQARLGDIQLRELITLFMDSHSDPNLLDCHGSSPLSLAIRTRILESTRYDIVDELCKGQADVNERDGSTYTPLHMAAYYGRASIARRLLEFGADLNSQAPPLPASWWVSRGEHRDPWWAGHETALHFASGRGHLHTVHLLITFKAQIEILDGRGQSWLQVATGSVATLYQAFLATTSQQATSGRCPRPCDVCAHTNAWTAMTGAASQTAAFEVHTTAPPAFVLRAAANDEQLLADRLANVLYSHRRDGDDNGHRIMCAASIAVTKMNDTIQCFGHRRGYVLLQAILRSALRPITSYQHAQIAASPVAEAGNPYAPQSSLFQQVCLLHHRDIRLWMQQLADLQRLLHTLEQYVQSADDPSALQWVRDVTAQVDDDYLLLHFSPNANHASQDGPRLLFPPVYDEADEHRKCP